MLYLAIALAGSAGAVTRALLAKLITLNTASLFPIATLGVNLTGSFLLGFFLTISAHHVKISPNLRLAVGSGFLGSYTTFSAFTLESANLMSNDPALFLFYIVSTSLGCVVLSFMGISSARTILHRKKPSTVEPSQEDG